MNDLLIKRILLITIILCGLSFYELAAVGYDTYKFLEFAGGLLIGLSIIVHLLYDPKEKMKGHFYMPIIIIFAAVFLSMFIAYSAHDQSFIVTAFAQRGIYYYLLYFMLHLFILRPNHLERIILVFGLLFIVLYILQYISYPVVFFESRISADRNTLRIFIPGLGFLGLAYFISLTKYLSDNKLIYGVFCLLAFVIFILLGTRQFLLSMILLTFTGILFIRTFHSKLIYYSLIILATLPVILMSWGIIQELLDVTKAQSANIEGNPRTKAAIYFLQQFFPNRISYLLGNGEASYATAFGEKIKYLKETYGYYQSDIGIIGEYTKYGLIFLAGVLVILWRALSKKIPQRFIYIRFFLIAEILTIFTGGSIFTEADNVIVLCLVFYLIDISVYEKEQAVNQHITK